MWVAEAGASLSTPTRPDGSGAEAAAAYQPQTDCCVPPPAAPSGPCGPVAPVAPVGPCAPVAPVDPGGPVAPVGPGGPAGPCGPATPVRTMARMTRCAGMVTPPSCHEAGTWNQVPLSTTPPVATSHCWN